MGKIVLLPGLVASIGVVVKIKVPFLGYPK